MVMQWVVLLLVKKDEMLKILDETVEYFPQKKPRYLMGVGTPSDILGQLTQVLICLIV